MSDIFILQNQDQLFLGKQKEWLDGRDPGSLFKTLHKDEAINQMVEISAKDYTQRIKVLPCSVNEKGLPLIAEELLPPPQPKPAKGSARNPVEDKSLEENERDHGQEEDALSLTETETAAVHADSGEHQTHLW